MPKTSPIIGAIDIGGTKIAVGLVHPDGKLLEQMSCPTEPHKGYADGLTRLRQMLQTCLARRPELHLTGIGIGCTGPVDPETGELGPNSFLPEWEGHNLLTELNRLFGVATAIENDADAAALAESTWGAGKGASSCLYITVSTGIGGGLIFNGKLFRGAAGAHPELGHHVIEPGGPTCFCGANGCWESLASGPALAGWYNAQSESGSDLADARQVCQWAEQGHSLALAAVAREGKYLGLGLANMVSLFIPEVIVLGGGVMESWHLFETQVRETIRQNCRLVPYEKTRLVRASLGMQTGLAGAGAVWLHRFGEELRMNER